MSAAEKMRMCLAEAGFVEGDGYDRIMELDSGGYIIFYGVRDSTALKAAVDKARVLISGPILEYPYTAGMWSCGSDMEEPLA